MHDMTDIEPYLLLEDDLTFEGNIYRTYGIAVVMSDKGDRQEYHNISKERSAVFDLVKMCNELLLDPIHLKDVVEDFLISV